MIARAKLAGLILVTVMVVGCATGNFTPPDKSFSIAMPGTARERIGLARTSQGQAPYQEYGCRYNQTSFSVGFTTIQGAEGAGDVIIREYAGRVAPDMQGCTSEAQPVSVDGHPGLDFKLYCDTQSTIGRLVVVGNRVYEISVQTRDDPDEREAKRFIESFRISS